MTDAELKALRGDLEEVVAGPAIKSVDAVFAEVLRLRGLVQEAEWGSHETSCCGYEEGYDESYDCCPWCGECGKHKADCSAFAANGVVR